jgi:hypothetical protein
VGPGLTVLSGDSPCCFNPPVRGETTHPGKSRRG